MTESAAWLEVTRPWFLLQANCEHRRCVNRRLPCCRGMVRSHDCRHAMVTRAVLEHGRIPSLSLASFVGVCLHCTVSSAYTSVHNLATHMFFTLQLPSSLTVGPLVPDKSCVSHFMNRCRTCVDSDSTIWYFVYLFHTGSGADILGDVRCN